MLTPTFYKNSRNSMICRDNIKNLMHPHKTKNKPQIPSRALEGRRHVCSAGIRGFPLPKGNRDADERRFIVSDMCLSAVIRDQKTKRKTKC